MILHSNTRVYLVLGSTDLRKAVNGLSLLVAGLPEMDVFSGQLFVFCNKSRTLIKILYWDRNGFCLWQKRLEKHRFFWPESREQALELGARELSWLLEGLDPTRMQGHPSLKYSTIF
ncbi:MULTISPECIES: IS66 family insertion sequence element accessory protein TnpB [Desulfovibrionaceae]|jgi:transposase|uniref:IS66 family insertion sequence element accessory protein TnpB n=1 Tax=Desulfovibrionaceae TaxID=194924 RepID=UPI00048E5B27|nr:MULTISPECIES: IS66 family insertion sequence element accessory protein TnpB [Desulfovibrionaceae]MDD3311750.1 IS66 family insertion sequence element accessory protein TnpB [Pseudodesulfovibrio sp.]MDK2956425.1 transposase [Desulfovibrionales bacterium]